MAGDDSHGGGPDVSPLMIGILGMLAGAIAVATYHCIAVGCYQMHSPDPPSGAVSADERRNNAATEDRSQEVASSGSSTSNSSAALIPVVRYSKERSESTCPVCLSDFNEGEPVRSLPVCSHVFHVACIDRWLLCHTNCPVCRANALPVSHVALTVPNMLTREQGSRAVQGRSISYYVG
ncbi:Putative RING-H2 finger protein ATL53 [Linum grandiflorum]